MATLQRFAKDCTIGRDLIVQTVEFVLPIIRGEQLSFARSWDMLDQTLL
jgi:hypothetical protein